MRRHPRRLPPPHAETPDTPRLFRASCARACSSLNYPAFARVRLPSCWKPSATRMPGPPDAGSGRATTGPAGAARTSKRPCPAASAPRRVVAQIKQFDGLHRVPAQRGRAAGSLPARGSRGSPAGDDLAFSGWSAQPPTGASGARVAPVRLIDGEELLGLMIRHRLGVREAWPSVGDAQIGDYEPRLEVDEAFFAGLAAAYRRRRPRTARRRTHARSCV